MRSLVAVLLAFPARSLAHEGHGQTLAAPRQETASITMRLFFFIFFISDFFSNFVFRYFDVAFDTDVE